MGGFTLASQNQHLTEIDSAGAPMHSSRLGAQAQAVQSTMQ
jgi:hypothetical protein